MRQGRGGARGGEGYRRCVLSRQTQSLTACLSVWIPLSLRDILSGVQSLKLCGNRENTQCVRLGDSPNDANSTRSGAWYFLLRAFIPYSYINSVRMFMQQNLFDLVLG